MMVFLIELISLKTRHVIEAVVTSPLEGPLEASDLRVWAIASIPDDKAKEMALCGASGGSWPSPHPLASLDPPLPPASSYPPGSVIS
jgi:hypothetical protein